MSVVHNWTLSQGVVNVNVIVHDQLTTALGDVLLLMLILTVNLVQRCGLRHALEERHRVEFSRFFDVELLQRNFNRICRVLV